jgi:CheY-like chemotaxis protein/anti-sigma regulatory factor (Ser/Thr protein kinase)
VSRVTSGKIVLVRRTLDLGELVTNTVNGWRSSDRLDRHRVSVEVTPVWVDVDEARIEQVVSNLVGNALKYTPAGGTVAVRIRPDGDTAVLEVEDTGVGIPAPLIGRVFDLFVQGERTIDRAQGGLGIGLTLVKALVEMHGGTVEATSGGQDRGSTFRIRLPRVAARPRPEPLPSPSAPERPRCRILVIEDNADARDMLRSQLELEGHDVHEASDGSSGVAAVPVVAPDIALIDLGLPTIDGYEVARRIRATAVGRSMVLIALTGYGQAEDRRRALEAGFDAHLTKPVLPQRLAEVIASSRRHAAR